MPSYYYHLQFELYPTADWSEDDANKSRAKSDRKTEKDEPKRPPVWQPEPGASIFDPLPWHYSTAQAAVEEPQDADRAAAFGDWRFGRVQIASFDMEGGRTSGSAGEAGETRARSTSYGKAVMPAASLGPVLGGAGQATRAEFHPLATTKTTDAGWGIVHLYREGRGGSEGEVEPEPEPNSSGSPEDGSDGTILCIPAVPSYLAPRDFLGFVGERWRDDVSHYRMVLTSRTNRYMVLLKFRDAGRARAWRSAFDGRVFNSMEAEICHVAYIRSIGITVPGGRGPARPVLASRGASSSSASASPRPFPPPTPDLIELPTCPVCLERMDDTAGLMTILCQHVFHCTCLQTWKGSGCPVCRATNPLPSSEGPSPAGGSAVGASSSAAGTAEPGARPFGAGISNLCAVCDCADDLWICLICGNVGCGRYKRGHAKDHWKETAHSFSLELETQYVWDYAGDLWVHRLIRAKGDGKVVELPGGATQPPDEEVVPRAKLDHIGLEYTHLLTSQLESQRVYFEELVRKAADKAAAAAEAAERATVATSEAGRELRALRTAHETLAQTTVPALERDLERERRRADKAADLARTLGRDLQAERRVSEGLMARIRHTQEQATAAQAAAAAAAGQVAELEEANRDLSMFISGQEKLRALEAAGQVEAGEVEEGTASVPEGKGKRRGKKR